MMKAPSELRTDNTGRLPQHGITFRNLMLARLRRGGFVQSVFGGRWGNSWTTRTATVRTALLLVTVGAFMWESALACYSVSAANACPDSILVNSCPEGWIVVYGDSSGFLASDLPHGSSNTIWISPGTGYIPPVRPGDVASITGLKLRGGLDIGAAEIYGIVVIIGTGTAVELDDFRVEREGRQATIQWSFTQPRAHAGFHVWRENPGSDRVRLDVEMLSGQDSYSFVDAEPPAGPADYWLQEVTTDRSDSWYGPAHLDAALIPTTLLLEQNQPNPFNPRTTFSFSLASSGRVLLAIYDLRGAQIATLVDTDLPAGEQGAEWGGLDSRGVAVPSGVYFARLETPTGVRTVKLTLAR